MSEEENQPVHTRDRLFDTPEPPKYDPTKRHFKSLKKDYGDSRKSKEEEIPDFYKDKIEKIKEQTPTYKNSPKLATSALQRRHFKSIMQLNDETTRRKLDTALASVHHLPTRLHNVAKNHIMAMIGFRAGKQRLRNLLIKKR